MAPQPIWIKRNPTTRSRLTLTLYAVVAASIYGLNASDIETLIPAGFLATLIGSVAVLMKLSSRSQRYYIQITADTLLVYRSLFLSPASYTIAEVADVKRTTPIFPGTYPVILTLSHGRKIRMSSWWLSEDDANRVEKIFRRRIRA